MTDPDTTHGEFIHWVVVNIPGNNLSKGNTLAEYIGSGPPPGTGIHKYVFLVYKQQDKQDFDEPEMIKKNINGRINETVKNFVAKHKLGDPTAGNFYTAQYDDYVPELYKILMQTYQQ